MQFTTLQQHRDDLLKIDLEFIQAFSLVVSARKPRPVAYEQSGLRTTLDLHSEALSCMQLLNANEFDSAHVLESVLTGDIKKVRERWSDDAKDQKEESPLAEVGTPTKPR